MSPVLTEEELAARNALIERMRKEQEMRDQIAKQQPQKVNEMDEERCPHGVPLRKSCPKCDVVTEDQIQDRHPLGRLG
jgi:hypothetical protein